MGAMDEEDDNNSVGSVATLEPDAQEQEQQPQDRQQGPPAAKDAALAATEVQEDEEAVPASQEEEEHAVEPTAIPDSLLEETQNSMHAMDLEDTTMQPTQQIPDSQSQDDQDDDGLDDDDDEKPRDSKKDDEDDDDDDMLAMQKELDGDDQLEMSQSQEDDDIEDVAPERSNGAATERDAGRAQSDDLDLAENLNGGESNALDTSAGPVFSDPADKQPVHVSRVVLPPGRAGLAVSADASRAFAAGSLGVRLLDVNKREVIKDLAEIEEALCVDAHPSDDLLACGTKNGHVRLVNAASGDLKTLLHRAPGPIRDVAFRPDGAKLAMATDENVVRIVDLSDPADLIELKGHSSAVKALAWAPQGDLIASVATNGQVIVWSVENGKAVKKLQRGTAPADSTEDPAKADLTQLAWDPSGKKLALTATTGILVLARDTWAQTILAPCPTSGAAAAAKSEARPTALAWSPNGVYIVYASAGGDLRLLNTRKEKDAGAALEHMHASSSTDRQQQSPVQRLVWPAKRHGALALTLDGNVHWFANIIPKESGDALAAPTLPQEARATEDRMEDEAEAEGGSGAKESSDDVVAIASQADETENSISRIRQEHGFGDAEDGGDDHMADELDMNDDLEDIGDGDGVGGGRSSTGGAFVTNRELESRIQRAVEDAQPAQFGRQPVLMPGSTPASEERRFLAWNSVGSITFRTEETHNSVEIDFANTVDHRRVRFSDHYGFTMAALGESGALFATPGELGEDNSGDLARDAGDNDDAATSKTKGRGVGHDDTDWDPGLPEDDMQEEIRAKQSESGVLQAYMELADQADAAGVAPEKLLGGGSSKDSTLAARMEARYGACSTLFYKSFDSRASNADWSARLPASEKARAVAAGASFAAVATNRRTLRIFRPSGLQEAPLMLPGPVLSMTGAGVFLLVVFHTGPPCVDGTQQVGYQLINVGIEGAKGGGIKGVAAQGSLPMPHGEPAPLKWVGLCDKSMGFMPACMDAKGTLMVLSEAMAWSWVPVLDENTLRRSMHDVVWPVSIQLGKLNAILLKGKGAHAGFPETYPRPVLSSFDLSVPLAGLTLATGSLKYKLEEETVRSHMVLGQLKWAAEAVGGAAPDDADALRVSEQKLMEAEAQLDAGVLKHLILAVKLNRGARAYGLVKRLRLDRSLQIAHQQAQQAGADQALLRRIERLIAIREEEARLAEEDDESDESDSEDSEDDVSVMEDGAGFDDTVEPTESRQPRRQQPVAVNKMRKRLAAKPPASALRSLSINEPSDSDDDLRSEASFEEGRKSNKLKARAASSSSASVASSAGSESPTQDTREMVSPTKKKRNPFALKKQRSQNQDGKDQSLMSSFKKAPVLTPKLNRQSTFTQEALASKSKNKPSSASKRRRL